MNNYTKLEKAIKLRTQKQYDESKVIFKELLVEFPNNGNIHYHFAWLNDNQANEKLAIGHYEKALELGLNDKDQRDCYLGLGSSYRAIGEYEKAKNIFEDAISLFPTANEFKIFLAIVKYNLKEYKDSTKELFHLLLETTADTDILKYKKALNYYADNLDLKI